MSKYIHKLSRSRVAVYQEQHRYEHWLVDNQIYFITARCRDKFPALQSEAAKQIFWTQFDICCPEFGFRPWVTTVLDNHYHTEGHLTAGVNLPRLMQRLHGSVAKLVNDLLPQRRSEFWRDAKGREYFDGCIRSEKQARLAYRYTLTNAQRHGLVRDYRDYRHTRVEVELESTVAEAVQLEQFLEGVPYKRYGT